MATNDNSAKPGHCMAADITVASKITASTELAPKNTGTENQHQQPASLEWVAELAKEDPDYEIDSDGQWTPRQRTGWTKEELAAADAAYQEPCKVSNHAQNVRDARLSVTNVTTMNVTNAIRANAHAANNSSQPKTVQMVQ